MYNTATSQRSIEYARAMRERELRRKARRRRLMIHRAVALSVFTAVVFSLVLAVTAFTKPDTIRSDMVLPNATTEKIPESTMLALPETAVVPETVKEAEPTIEELVASGYLTDDIALSYELQMVARDAAKEFGVPYKLLLAVMFRESSYNPEAANDICFGLMQIHKMNFEWLEGELSEYGVDDIKNEPRDNIYAGAYMLGDLISRYGDYHKALICYNCGETRARELFAQGYTSTQYSRNVHATMDELKVCE